MSLTTWLLDSDMFDQLHLKDSFIQAVDGQSLRSIVQTVQEALTVGSYYLGGTVHVGTSFHVSN